MPGAFSRFAHWTCLLIVSNLIAVCANAQFREWKDNSGLYSVEAKLVRVDKSSLVLEKSSGVIIEVPFERISTADLYRARALAAKLKSEELATRAKVVAFRPNYSKPLAGKDPKEALASPNQPLSAAASLELSRLNELKRQIFDAKDASDELAERVLAMVDSKYPQVRKGAFEVYLNLESGRTFEEAVARLEDKQFDIRWLAIDWLAASKRVEGLPFLYSRISSEDNERIVAAIGQFGRDAVPYYLKMLELDAEACRICGCKLLGRFGAKSSLARLRSLAVNETSLRVRLEASAAIERISSRNSDKSS